MPNDTHSKQASTEGIPPEWIKVQESSDIFDEMCNELIDEVRRLPLEEPVPGSIRASDDEVDEVALALTLCSRDHLLFALDHALGASKCVKHPTLSHAAYACARVVIETCSTLHWLVDTADGTDGVTRIARLQELRSRDLWNERKWHMRLRENSGRDEEEIKESIEQRIKNVIAIADHLNIPYKRTDSEHRPIFAILEDATARVGRVIENADLDYRLYSRVMHCETPAAAETWMVQPNPLDLSELFYDPEIALRLIISLANWVAGATHALNSYCGHDLDGFDKRIRAYFTRLGID